MGVWARVCTPASLSDLLRVERECRCPFKEASFVSICSFECRPWSRLDDGSAVEPPTRGLVAEVIPKDLEQCGLLFIKLLGGDVHLLNANLVSFGQHPRYYLRLKKSFKSSKCHTRVVGTGESADVDTSQAWKYCRK
jgi:hypothetical protein